VSVRILYGGTFDPVHNGHLAIARAVATAFDHPVSLLPAADPPHRPAPGASAEQRASMLELAIGDDPRLQVDRRELLRNGPSFTVDTLAEVRAEIGPAASLVWVLGVDSLAQLETWHQWRRIFELASVLGVERPGAPADPEWLQRQAPVVHAHLLPRWQAPAALAATPAGGYAALAMLPLRTESATDIRARIASGRSWARLVPPPVAAYIRAAGLYRPGPER
jgi:nicotinate-nucleotide adenylyltransferase